MVLWSGGTSGTFGAAILPVTAGGFIYLALVDVMPSKSFPLIAVAA
jgi:zinc transporter ZupT